MADEKRSASGDGMATDGGEELLRVPEAEADAALSAANGVIEDLGRLAATRSAARELQLASWEGPARRRWDEEFAYAQADVQSHIDATQTLKGEIYRVMQRIREHNDDVRRAQPVFLQPPWSFDSYGSGDDHGVW